MNLIYLIGMPGCGKSTLARALCEAGKVDGYIDLDGLVEQRAGCSVHAVITQQGEAAFRSMEAEALEEVARRGGGEGRTLVVATGGGAPCRPENMERMLATGRVVWLQAGTERSLERLADAPGQRPAADRAMARGRLREWFEGLQRERAPHYGRAHYRFDTTELDTPEAIADAVARFSELLP